MFGLEDRKKKSNKKSIEETYDLEIEIADPVKGKQIKEKVEQRIQKLKQVLRSGEKKEEYESLGVLLHGYAAFHRLIMRLSRKR